MPTTERFKNVSVNYVSFQSVESIMDHVKPLRNLDTKE